MAQTEDCVRKCRKVGEMEAVEVVGCVNVMRARAVEVASSDSSSKRRKMGAKLGCQLKNSPEKSASPASSEASSIVAVLSHCSSNDMVKFAGGGVRSVDLKVESNGEAFEAEISTLISCRFRGMTPSTDLILDMDEVQSSSAVMPQPAKMPSPEEIEEFFSAEDKYEQKRFADKYNYDVAKDVPLEGRYQWVRLKP